MTMLNQLPEPADPATAAMAPLAPIFSADWVDFCTASRPTAVTPRNTASF